MSTGQNIDPAVFDAAALAAVQRLISPERVQLYLVDLARQHLALVASAASDTSLESRAHMIVSQAGMLGLSRMSQSARALEDACRSGQGRAAALLQCRSAAGDIERYAVPAAG